MGRLCRMPFCQNRLLWPYTVGALLARSAKPLCEACTCMCTSVCVSTCCASTHAQSCLCLLAAPLSYPLLLCAFCCHVGPSPTVHSPLLCALPFSPSSCAVVTGQRCGLCAAGLAAAVPHGTVPFKYRAAVQSPWPPPAQLAPTLTPGRCA